MTQRQTHDVLSFDYPANPPVGANLFFEDQGAGTWNVQSTIARTSKALRLQPAANQAWVERMATTLAGVGVHDDGTFRFYIYINDTPDADCYLISWQDFSAPSTKHAGFAWNSATSRIRPIVAGTNGTDSSAISTGVWYRIDTRMTYNVGTGDYLLEWQLDGVAQTSLSTNTANGPSMNGVTLGNWDANCTGDWAIDDYVGLQPIGDFPPYPIGAGECYYRVSTSDGTHNTAGNFSDEVPNSPPAAVSSRLDEGPSTSTTDYVWQDTASGTSYLEVNMDTISSTAVRMHGGMLRWAHTRAASAGNTMTVRSWSPSQSVEWGAVGTCSIFADKRYAPVPLRGTTDETTFTMTLLNQSVVRLGYSTDVSTELRAQDIHEEWALAAAPAGNDGWGWGDGTERWHYV